MVPQTMTHFKSLGTRNAHQHTSKKFIHEVKKVDWSTTRAFCAIEALHVIQIWGCDQSGAGTSSAQVQVKLSMADRLTQLQEAVNQASVYKPNQCNNCLEMYVI